MKKPTFALFFILCSLLISCVQYLDDFILVIKNDSSLDLRISIETKSFPGFNKDVEVERGDSISLYDPPSDAKYFALMPTSPPFMNDIIVTKITFSNLDTGEIIKEMDRVVVDFFKGSSNKGKGMKAGGFRQEYLLTVTDSLLFEN